jgi:uncharacterized protein YgiM (DUF1202 family)
MKKFTMFVVMLAMLACGISAPLALLPTATAPATAKSVNTETHIITLTPKCQGVVTAGRLNLRASPDYLSPADSQGLVKGDAVTLLYTIGNWYYVETSDGRTGWANRQFVKGCE